MMLRTMDDASPIRNCTNSLGCFCQTVWLACLITSAGIVLSSGEQFLYFRPMMWVQLDRLPQLLHSALGSCATMIWIPREKLNRSDSLPSPQDEIVCNYCEKNDLQIGVVWQLLDTKFIGSGLGSSSRRSNASRCSPKRRKAPLH